MQRRNSGGEPEAVAENAQDAAVSDIVGEPDPLALIDALYTLSDITAEINGQTSLERVGLVYPEDIGLVDDLIDVLQDPRHADHARAVLRDAVAQIALHALMDRG